MADKVKIGFPLFDMLRFKNTAKRREKVIEKTPVKEIKGDWPINANERHLHPEHLDLVISGIIDHAGSNAKTYILRKRDNSPLPYFKAGEYLSIKLNIEGSSITRPYSISSSPLDALKGEYRITVGNKKDGFASPWILSSWKKGDSVLSSAPLGDFVYEPLRDEKNVIAVAGGSGITPFLSMAEAIYEKTEGFSLTILYGSKTKKAILFYDELERLTSDCNKIKVIHVLSDEEREGFEHGFINSDLIKKYAPEDGKYSLFFSGSRAMYDFLLPEIEKLNIPGKNFRRELPPPERKTKRGKSFLIKVKTLSGERIIPASSDETILTSLERSGIKTDSRCRSGECSWCRSRLLEGDVYIPPENDMRRYADKNFGYIHPCSCFPESDITLEIPGL